LKLLAFRLFKLPKTVEACESRLIIGTTVCLLTELNLEQEELLNMLFLLVLFEGSFVLGARQFLFSFGGYEAVDDLEEEPGSLT
jgi:hypothetical protein